MTRLTSGLKLHLGDGLGMLRIDGPSGSSVVSGIFLARRTLGISLS